jgi:hypothetical protein
MIMKYITLLFLIPFTFYSQLSNENLVLQATFDNNFIDDGPNSFSITNNGCGLDIDRHGNYLSSILLNGTSNFLTLNNNQPVITTLNFTISGWAKMSGNGGGLDNQNNLFEQRDDDASVNAKSTILLMPRHNDNNSLFIVRSGINNNGSISMVSHTRPSFNEWHHYIGVKCDNEIHLYIDGQLVGSSPYTQTGDFVTSIDHVSIGGHNHTFNSIIGAFNGNIDDVRIYDKCLNLKDIIDLYNSSFLNLVKHSNEFIYTLYPNPNNGNFVFKYDEYSDLNHLKITDLSGKLISTVKINKNQNQVEFNEQLEKGVYFLNAIDSSKKVLKSIKFIVD